MTYSFARSSSQAGLMLSVLLIALTVLTGCGGGNGIRLGPPDSALLSVIGPRSASVGESVRLGLSSVDDLTVRCPACPESQFAVVTSQGTQLGTAEPGQSVSATFDAPGLYVVHPALGPRSPDIELGTNQGKVIVVSRHPSDSLVPAGVEISGVARSGDSRRLEITALIENSHLQTRSGERFGFRDPRFHQVRINLVGIGENGEELYRGDAITTEVRTRQSFLFRHTPPDGTDPARLRLTVGAVELVPTDRDLFLVPNSYSVDLPAD